MGYITVKQAAAWCGGQYEEKYADVAFLGANMDSRKLEPGQLFIALEGERDGHDYIPAAFEKGAAAVLCRRKVGDYPAIYTENPHDALGMIAAGERQRIGMQVVGVTGSVGKSTTKEMIACCLEGDYRVSKTPANFNNDIGMPMAILAMPDTTQVAVLEMGMSDFREIAYLAQIGKPDAAVITNVGTMHIEQLGTRQGILQAKLEILEGLKEGGTLCLCGDNDLLWGARDTLGREATYFGAENEACQVKASAIEEAQGSLSFHVKAWNTELDVTIPVEGLHFVPDALAAVSIALSMGVSPQAITRRLADFRNMEGRQEIFQVNGYTVISDCYNAGPESMAAALAVLGKRQGRKIAVLGDMLELGSQTQAEHYRIGRIAAENAQVVLAYGPNAPRVVNGAVTGGIHPNHAIAFDDRDRLAKRLKNLVCPGDVLLFKGSHGMHMELVLQQLLSDEER